MVDTNTDSMKSLGRPRIQTRYLEDAFTEK